MSMQMVLLLAVVATIKCASPVMAQRVANLPPGGIPIKWTAEDILTQTRSVYLGNSLIRLGFTMEVENRIERNELRSSVVDSYRVSLISDRKDRSRVEVRGVDFDILRVVDGRLSWYYLPDTGVYAKYEADERGQHRSLGGEDSRYQRRVNMAAEVLTNYTMLYPKAPRPGHSIILAGEEYLEIGSKRHHCFVIEMGQTAPDRVPTNGGERIQRLWIDRETFVVWREELISGSRKTDGQKVVEVKRINFHEVVWNEKPGPETFYFEAPAAVRLVSRLSVAARPEVTLVKVGDEAPDFTLPNLDGQVTSLSGLRGKVVLVNFWATWCGPCRIEMPHLEKLYQEYHKQGVVFLTISDEDPETIRQFLKTQKYSFGSMVDAKSIVSSLYGVRGIPHTFLIDRLGRVTAGLPGSQKETDLREAIIKGLNAQSVAAGDTVIPIRRMTQCLPKLLSPTAGGVVDVMLAGQNAWWLFRWQGCLDISRFHFQIFEPKGGQPLFDYEGLTTLSYRFPLQDKIGKGTSLKGWRWRVRGQSRGVWGEWVESGFEVRSLQAVEEKTPAPPVQVLPGHRQVLDYRPRQVEIVREPIPGAAFYRVEIDLYSNGTWNSQTPGRSLSVIQESATSTKIGLGAAQLAPW